jgi:hypothetical protein
MNDAVGIGILLAIMGVLWYRDRNKYSIRKNIKDFINDRKKGAR